MTAHLLILGWVSSLVFGAGYMILPVMASTRLWSLRLAWVHLALHALGVPWMVTGFLWMDFAEVGHGGSAIFVGIILAVINLMKTASRFNRWDPAAITFLFAFFWLLANSALAILMLVNKFIPVTELDPQHLIGIHAHLGLIGFLWMVLLGASLKLLPMFLISEREPGALSWLGCVLMNIGLVLIIMIGLYSYDEYRVAAIWLLAIGTLFYFIDIARTLFSARRKIDWGILTNVFGLLSGGVLFVWVLAGSPICAEETVLGIREQMGIYFTLAIFGPFTLSIFGMGTRIIPFLIWQLRYAPRVGREKLPTVQDLSRKSGLLPLWISLCLGWLYLAAGQLTGQIIGAQIGIMLMLIGTGWFFYTLRPALRAMLADDIQIANP